MKSKRTTLGLVLALSYVALVFGVDVARSRGCLPAVVRETLVQLHLVTSPSGFDWYKFVTWFLIPVLATFPVERRVGVHLRITKYEAVALGVVVALSCAAMGIVVTSAELSAQYLGSAMGNWGQRLSIAERQLIWTLSWLPGYEFLVRRILLSRAEPWRSGAVVLVALVEFVYHLQKPMLEAVAVLFFSAALSVWARKRRGSLWPPLAHLCVELVLIGFVAVYGL